MLRHIVRYEPLPKVPPHIKLHVGMSPQERNLAEQNNSLRTKLLAREIARGNPQYTPKAWYDVNDRVTTDPSKARRALSEDEISEHPYYDRPAVPLGNQPLYHAGYLPGIIRTGLLPGAEVKRSGLGGAHGELISLTKHPEAAKATVLHLRSLIDFLNDPAFGEDLATRFSNGREFLTGVYNYPYIVSPNPDQLEKLAATKPRDIGYASYMPNVGAYGFLRGDIGEVKIPHREVISLTGVNWMPGEKLPPLLDLPSSVENFRRNEQLQNLRDEINYSAKRISELSAAKKIAPSQRSWSDSSNEEIDQYIAQHQAKLVDLAQQYRDLSQKTFKGWSQLEQQSWPIIGPAQRRRLETTS